MNEQDFNNGKIQKEERASEKVTDQEVFKPRSSLSRTPPTGLRATEASDDNDLNVGAMFDPEQREEIVTALEPDNTTEHQKEQILQQKKRKRLDSPQENVGGGSDMRQINTIMAILVKRTAELKRHVQETSKTKVEIKRTSTEVYNLVDGLEKAINAYQAKRTEGTTAMNRMEVTTVLVNKSTQTDVICSTTSMGTQVDLPENDTTETELREQVENIMEKGTCFEDVLSVLDEEWPEEIYVNTQTATLNPVNLNNEGDYAIVTDSTDHMGGIMEHIALKYPEVYELMQKSDGQVDYLINTIATCGKNREKSQKTTALYLVPLDITGESLADVRNLYNKIKELKETMEVHPTSKINLIVNKRVNLDHVRKIVEYAFHDKSLTITIMSPRGNHEAQTSKRMKPQVGKVVVKRGEATYAELLKNVKDNVDIQKAGIQVRSIRKTLKGDLLLEVEGGQIKATELKEAIEEKVDNEVHITNYGTVLHVLDIDATTTIKDVENGINSAVGHRNTEFVKVKALRPSRDGNQIATVHTTRNVAKLLLNAKRVKIGWVNCRVKERIKISRCFKCLEFGHLAAECKGPDRSNICINCNQPGHKAKDCNNTQFCSACQTDEHRADTTRCPKFRQMLKEHSKPKSTEPKRGSNGGKGRNNV